jgi:Holliday junction resolvasome RuvABC DNA-binding subunit
MTPYVIFGQIAGISKQNYAMIHHNNSMFLIKMSKNDCEIGNETVGNEYIYITEIVTNNVSNVNTYHYGFLSLENKILFDALIESINGINHFTAYKILDGYNHEKFAQLNVSSMQALLKCDTTALNKLDKKIKLLREKYIEI